MVTTDSWQQHRKSTLHVNVAHARHLTFDFVNGAFVSVTKRKSNQSATKCDNNELEVTTIENNNVVRIESAESTVL